MKKERAYIEATVRVQSVREDKIKLIRQNLPKSIFIDDSSVMLVKHNQNEVFFRITYGPVWGCWRSDITKHFNNAISKAGSLATHDITTIKRVVVETR